MAKKNIEPFLKDLAKIESLAEDVLAQKEQITQLEQKRKINKEALNILKQQTESTPKGKIWLMAGPLFIKAPVTQAQQLIQKDQTNLDKAISTANQDLKYASNKLTELQNASRIAENNNAQNYFANQLVSGNLRASG